MLKKLTSVFTLSLVLASPAQAEPDLDKTVTIGYDNAQGQHVKKEFAFSCAEFDQVDQNYVADENILNRMFKLQHGKTYEQYKDSLRFAPSYAKPDPNVRTHLEKKWFDQRFFNQMYAGRCL